jgi:hypothetical protein
MPPSIRYMMMHFDVSIREKVVLREIDVMGMCRCSVCGHVASAGSEQPSFMTFMASHLSYGLILVGSAIWPFSTTVFKLSLHGKMIRLRSRSTLGIHAKSPQFEWSMNLWCQTSVLSRHNHPALSKLQGDDEVWLTLWGDGVLLTW